MRGPQVLTFRICTNFMACTGLFMCVAPVGCHTSWLTGKAERVTTQPADVLARKQEESARLTDAGIRARHAENLELARTKLLEATQLDPTNGRAQHALGLAYYDLGDLYNAAVRLDRASHILRNHFEPYYNLGVALEDGAKYELAIKAYGRALRRRTDHLQTLENLARVRIKAGLLDLETVRLLELCREREFRTEWAEWLNQEASRLDTRLEKTQTGPALSETRSESVNGRRAKQPG